MSRSSFTQAEKSRRLSRFGIEIDRFHEQQQQQKELNRKKGGSGADYLQLYLTISIFCWSRRETSRISTTARNRLIFLFPTRRDNEPFSHPHLYMCRVKGSHHFHRGQPSKQSTNEYTKLGRFTTLFRSKLKLLTKPTAIARWLGKNYRSTEHV